MSSFDDCMQQKTTGKRRRKKNVANKRNVDMTISYVVLRLIFAKKKKCVMQCQQTWLRDSESVKKNKMKMTGKKNENFCNGTNLK